MPELSLTDFFLANLVLAIGTLLQCVIGYGVALVAAPLLFLINPAFVPAPLIMISVLLTVLLTVRERQALRLDELRWSVLGNVVGTALAGLTLLWVGTAGFDVMFGLLILAAVLISLLGFRPQISRGNCATAGLASGYMATLTSIGGPPMALLYQNAHIQHVRANLSAYFVFAAANALLALLLVGKLGEPELWLFLSGAPGVLLGFALSGHMLRRLSIASVKPAILLLATASALVALYRGLS